MAHAADFILLAAYNSWMNDKLYTAAATLPAEQLRADRGAFFGSLIGTLNHIVAGDTIWLKRFATHPVQHAALDPLRAMAIPAALDAHFSDDLPRLAAQRKTLDVVIEQWVAGLTQQDLDHVLHYQNSKGVVSDKRLAHLLLHFFNHQTHHRGQASTLLSQAGVDVGVTDLLALLPNVAPG
jgi:uncharacterized damage-inducible protein DinB